LVNLTLHNEVYTFVKRLTAKHLIEKGLDTTQPLTRREIAKSLIEVSEKFQAGQIELTDVEKKHLRYFQWLFGDELETLKPGFLSPTKKRHAITVKSENYKIDFDLKLKQEGAFAKPSLGERQNTSITSMDIIVRAKLGPHLGVSSILHTHALTGSTDYNPYRTEPTRCDQGISAVMRSMEGYIVLVFPWMSIQWGIDEAWWGPGWHGALLVSDNSAPKDNFKISGSYGPFKYTYFTAILREKYGGKFPSKYMSAHRLEVLLYPGIDIGLSEVIVFADRYEPRYLNPFISYNVMQAEDNNALLGGHFDITLAPSIEFYGELMVDDFRLPLRDWANKFGILLGGYWTDPFGLRDTDVRIEYAFVNQYAYAHRYDATRYTHEGYVIGHWMGTDADDLWCDIKHWLTDKVRVSLTYERERQGEGDVNIEHLEGENIPVDINSKDEYWEFLSGVTESTHSFSMGLSYISIGRYSAGAEYTHSQIRNDNHKPGVDGKEHQLVMKAEYRF